MAGELALGGVFSSIDYEALIQGMMQQEYAPYNRLQEQKSDYNSQNTAISTIQSKFSAFESVASNITSTNLRRVTASSSDSDVLTATPSAGAQEGSHTVEINQLATSHRIVDDVGLEHLTSKVGTGGSKSVAENANTVADADATWFTTGANGATYTFDFGDEEDITVTFEASTAYSMNEVAALINSSSQSVASYDAAAVTDLGGTFRLDLTAKDKGAVGEMTVTLDEGDSIDELNDDIDWAKTDGTDVAAGAFVYTYNGVTRTINTDADTTLEDLRDLINNDGSNPGVTASILSYGGTYRLVLAGNDTGEDYSITIDDSLTTIDGFDTADFYEAQSAQNAKYRIDGFPAPGNYMESASNTVTDALPNMTLSFNDTGTATISATRNTTGLKNYVKDIVTKYNALVETINLYCGYDEATEKGGILQGDSTITNLLSPITNMLTGNLSGFDRTSDVYINPVDLGIEIDDQGQLSLDEDELTDALESNYEQVVRFLSADGRGVTSDDDFQFSSGLETTEAGTYEVKVDYAGDVITAAYFRRKGETTWREADVDGNTITGLEGNDEAGLTLNVTVAGTGSKTAEVQFQRGLGPSLEALGDTVLDSTDGPLAIRREQNEEAIDNLESRIEQMEDRLERKEESYRAKFARLEATLAQLDSFRGAFESLFSQLASNKSSGNSNS